jgi:hypothetical protein
MTAHEIPVEHLLVHVRDALATDERVGELGLDVRPHPGTDPLVVEVRGTLSTDERKAGVVAVVEEALGAHGRACVVRDLTRVAGAQAPTAEAETL